MNKDSYFIKEGYIPNELNLTMDSVSGEHYYQPASIELTQNYMHQFYVYRYACDYAEKQHLNTLLDIGCGLGRKLSYIHNRLPELRITGIDQEYPVRFCRETYNFGEWFVDDIEKPTLQPKNKTDLIICSDVIEHLLEPDKLLDYIRRFADKETIIVISTPERDKVRGTKCNYSPNKHHIREWNFSELESYLAYQGFQFLDHFIQLPAKLKWDKLVIREILIRTLRFQALRYNQVCVLKIK
jgi:SAM-dependent methyltransferase